MYGSKFNVAKGNMLPLVQALASMLILSSISTCSAADSLNLIIHKGENFSFDCCENPDRVTKSFIIHPPNEDKIYSAFEDQPFVNKKVTAIISETCEVNIKEAGLEDNGLWKCDVFIQDENSKSTSISHRYINVTLSAPQEQESDRTLVIVLSIFGVGVFIVAVACYVCIPCHGQNNNGLDNNPQEGTAPDTGNVLNNTDREGNSQEDTAAATGNNQGNIGPGTSSPSTAIQITESAEDNTGTGSNSQEGSTRNLDVDDKISLEMDSPENNPRQINIIPKTPKKKYIPPYGPGGHNGW